ncbi:MAG TPA: hypothetical protein VF702_07665 [Allosphingosinicella sp.]
MTRGILGAERSADGLLLTKRHYLEPDQEWRLGLALLGLSGLPIAAAIMVYLQTA